MLDDDSLAEIKQIFIEEADEGLAIMETGLLELESGEGAIELINDIFRAAHSIKGGSATFGFTDVSEFTHLMETLLDQMRDGSREVVPTDIQILLRSVDCLRAMMDAIKEGGEVEDDMVSEVTNQLEAALADEATKGPVPVKENPAVADSKQNELKGQGWKIQFSPSLNMLRTGNDPVGIFRELASLGDLTVESDLSNLPSFLDLDPESCYVSWQLTLLSEATKEQITEVFDWVAEEAHIEIKAIGEENPPKLEIVETAAEATLTKAADSDSSSATRPTAIKKAAPKVKDAGSIRVGIDKIDSLLNLVGELVITQSMLNRYSKEVMEEIGDAQSKDLEDGLTQLAMNARELQEVAMQMRMLPIKTTFSRFPRLVHDLSLQLGKKIDLKIIGEHTELDKTVLEKIGDPLVHLVRNGLDHGIETPEERLKAGKSESGTLTLEASHQAGNIVIEITDDGKGINSEKILAKARERGLVAEEDNLTPEKINYLIFHPGLSTAQELSDVSGRGVGMDVVKRNIQDLGGRVEVQSEEGKGSKFTIRLPLTLAILDGQLVEVGKETYIVPLLSIIETVVVDETKLNAIAHGNQVYRMRGEYIPVIALSDVFFGSGKNRGNPQDSSTKVSVVGKLLVIVEASGKLVGLVVDDLLDQQQVVLKSLESNYSQLAGLSGATILGDGAVSLIIDIPGLIESYFGPQDAAASLLDLVAA